MAARAAEAKVEEWRASDELYLPTIPEQKVDELRGTLEYPPKGAPEERSQE